MADDVATAAEAARNCALSNGASADIRTACRCRQTNTQEGKGRAASATWNIPGKHELDAHGTRPAVRTRRRT